MVLVDTLLRLSDVVISIYFVYSARLLSLQPFVVLVRLR